MEEAAHRRDGVAREPPSGLGADLRALRKARGLTLKALAGEVGRSVGCLSEIERDLRAPATDDLRRLARALDQPISLFFGAAAGPEAERGHVVRAGARRRLGGVVDGLTEELLSPDLTGGFEILRSVFAPGAEQPEPQARPTEEAGYLISGRLDLWIGERRFALGPGDSFRFRDEPYRWRNPGRAPAVAIWVIAPPVY